MGVAAGDGSGFNIYTMSRRQIAVQRVSTLQNDSSGLQTR